MVYWIIAAILPTRRPLEIALYSWLLAALVELSRLGHTSSVDAFRVTLAGRLLLGRFFSLEDILVYWIAIACAGISDSKAAAPFRW